MSACAKTTRKNRAHWVAPTVTVAGLLAIWQLVCMAGLVPTYLLPSPPAAPEPLGHHDR